MPKRIGRYTLRLENSPAILSYAAVAGKKEGLGPLGYEFDKIYEDTTAGESSWEKAESLMLRDALSRAIEKSGYTPGSINYVFAGDLLNQGIASTYGLRDLGIPFFGLYGACSNMSLSMTLASVYVESGAASLAACATSSHFCAAERQFRFPLEYGGQRTPTAQWTVTGAGALVLAEDGPGPFITRTTGGRIVDKGVRDMTNMGAAMAPAAADTIKNFFDDTGASPNDYDMILTGDLGLVGSRLLNELLKQEKLDIGERHRDCGILIFDCENQDVESGGSGCGCSAGVLCTHILNLLRDGGLSKILFCATGALMSPTSSQQGDSIPCIAHLVEICANRPQ
ncbi:MAG TPA: stage V sporulation protein AD [Ruminococcaceae bacterium]|nr:stage V sporulation protein AD [Oscillospiraceae bacterium]